MRLEIALIYLGTIGLARLISQFRDSFLIRDQPTFFVALLLLYLPVLHQRLRHFRFNFFEKNFSDLIRSLKIFSLTSLIILPLFLIGNHFYQLWFFNRPLAISPVRLESLILPELFLIALPEEFFFRGWLQTLLRKNLKPVLAILVTSLLFALAHSLIQVQWWHFSIFFPGLVFGWLKEKTGAITAPILFHAVSNILVAWVNVSYG